MKRKWVVVIVLIFISAGLSACGEAVSVNGTLPGDGGTNSLMLSWTAPITNEDESSLEDLAGYRIYYGRESRYYSGSYSYFDDVGKNTVAEIGNLSSDTWYLAVTAYDYFGNESDYSNEVSYTFY